MARALFSLASLTAHAGNLSPLPSRNSKRTGSETEGPACRQPESGLRSITSRKASCWQDRVWTGIGALRDSGRSTGAWAAFRGMAEALVAAQVIVRAVDSAVGAAAFMVVEQVLAVDLLVERVTAGAEGAESLSPASGRPIISEWFRVGRPAIRRCGRGRGMRSLRCSRAKSRWLPRGAGGSRARSLRGDRVRIGRCARPPTAPPVAERG